MTEGIPPSVGWRLVRERYADLSGEGARRRGGRWNSAGRPVVYLAEDAALSVLEVLVHLDLSPELVPVDYVLMHVAFEANAASLEDGPVEPLSLEESRRFGDAWLDGGRTAFLRVPSVIVPESRILVLNPTHPAVSTLAPPSWRPFRFDPRLL